MQEFGKERLSKDRVKFYGSLQAEFYAKLTEVCKLFLKKDTQKPFLEWIYALVVGNQGKAKLGSKFKGGDKDLSHDGFVVNIFVCMLNLCKPFLSKEV